jgi:hypothetical protein
MGFKKFGDKNDGKIVPETDDDQRTAKKAWTDKDAAELAEENRGADGSSD